MATFSYPASVVFGSTKTGLGTSVGYRVVDAGGTVRIARTTAGITERLDAGGAATGTYDASPTLDTSWGYVKVLWDATGQAGLIGTNVVHSPAALIDVAVSTVKAKTDNLPSDPASASTVAGSFTAVNATLGTLALQSTALAVKAKTDLLAFTGGNVNSAAQNLPSDYALQSTALAIKAKTDNLPASPAAVGSAMKLDFTQAVPQSNTAQTVGDALNGARAQAFGKWAIVGNLFSMYGGDGTTVVRQFTLDSATHPTNRS